MTLNRGNPETEKLAETPAGLTEETETDAVTQPSQDRPAQRRLADELEEIAIHCSRLPVLDPRTPDEILGYAETPSVPE